jgi:hypothetical protein
MNHPHVVYRLQVLLLTILGLVTLFGPVADAHTARTSLAGLGPLIHASIAQPLGSVLVTGDGFSPGGRVYVVLYDQWGQQLHENRWVTASASVDRIDGTGYGSLQGGTINETFGSLGAIAGPHGNQDSANRYVAGNPKHEVADNFCGTAIMVRAYDAQTELWSNVLDIDPCC